MKVTQKEVEEATKELHEAMIESIDAQQCEDQAKLRKIKAHKRLCMARDVIRNITFSY